MIPTWDQLECMELIPGCDISNGIESSYFVKDGKYSCLKCLKNLVWDSEDEECKECEDYVDGCKTCAKNAQGHPECQVCEDPSYMPSLDGLRCVKRIENCLIPTLYQPQGLMPHPNGIDWVCKQCNSSYFLDNDLLELDEIEDYSVQCVPCDVQNCEVCSTPGTCDKCHDFDFEWNSDEFNDPEDDLRNHPLMLSPDNMRCVPKIPHCKAAIEAQPLGLEVMYDAEEPFWYCNECDYGFYLDRNTYQCTRCKDVVDDCQTCEEDIDYGFRCLTCEFDLVPNVLTCDSLKIPNCKIVSEKSDELCDLCHWSFGRSPDARKCIPCETLALGCTSCTLDQFGVPSTCLSCAENLELNEIDNVCEFENCLDDYWHVNLDFLEKKAVATCDKCEAYFGRWEYETDLFICESCDNGASWVNCD